MEHYLDEDNTAQVAIPEVGQYIPNSPEWHFQNILYQIGERPEREGLLETPKRYIKFLREFLNKEEFNFTTFTNEGGDEMIFEGNIQYYSLCEHHTVPFFGKAYVAYIPGEKIVGISKLARCVDYFAKNFQNQERITKQVAELIQEVLQAKGVAVLLEGQHMCMCMRGVKKDGVNTITQFYTGDFKHNKKLKKDFLKLARK